MASMFKFDCFHSDFSLFKNSFQKEKKKKKVIIEAEVSNKGGF